MEKKNPSTLVFTLTITIRESFTAQEFSDSFDEGWILDAECWILDRESGLYMLPSADVVIIGAGAIGCSIAFQVAKAGLSVAVLDKGEIGREASWASAGILTHGNPGSSNEYAKMATESRAMFPFLAAELKELTGLDPEYRESGGLHLFFTEDTAAEGKSYFEQSIRLGISAQWLDPSDAVDLEPTIAHDVQGAIRFTEDGSIRNPRYVRSLALGANRLGAKFYVNQPVTGFLEERGRIKEAITLTDRIEGGYFVIAAGAWSSPLGACLDVRIPVVPSRGQIALLESIDLRVQHVIHAGAHYLVPRCDGKVILGATVEYVGYDKSTTVEGIQSLLEWCLRVSPGLSNAKFVACWSGLRPAPEHGGPIIRRMTDYENLIVATGHNRNGILLSPVTGHIVSDMIIGAR